MVSVVIVCMNRLDNLYPCLNSIIHYTKVEYEIIVVAYKFSKENLTKLHKDFPAVQVIISKEIRGFSENNNLALRTIKSDYCFILNDDTELVNDVISRLTTDFKRLPRKAAIVSPTLLNPDMSLQLCGRPKYPWWRYALQQWHLYTEPINDTIKKKAVCRSVYKTSNISGAAFMIKTSLFRKVGWFDEDFFFTPEDIALSTLLRNKGYGIYVDSKAKVVHKWRTTASTMSVALRPSSIRGSLMFFAQKPYKSKNYHYKIRYAILGFLVWTAEWSKYLKAYIRHFIYPTKSNLYKKLTFRANCHAIFTHKTPKELFMESL